MGQLTHKTRSLTLSSHLTTSSRKETIQFDKARSESRPPYIVRVLTRRTDHSKDTQALLWA